MKYLEKLAQFTLFLPAIFCFSYLLRPVLMVILIPGGLVFLAILGGKEVREELMKMIKEQLWSSPTSSHKAVR
ncbi:hypothetical protein [Vibrio japonicus]|uniref:Uncharacterized protein n=1 Tax=Vibrio japonicus TaxID=1824638 RepID=A0ABY5LGX4_9VIBR|nr:hypothetical protein [Vibrio japonicus]UUM30063.1 hypothetical protein NP165_10135 [Vibrio japonicus]